LEHNWGKTKSEDSLNNRNDLVKFTKGSYRRFNLLREQEEKNNWDKIEKKKQEQEEESNVIRCQKLDTVTFSKEIKNPRNIDDN
jgi:hypothetical protein